MYKKITQMSHKNILSIKCQSKTFETIYVPRSVTLRFRLLNYLYTSYTIGEQALITKYTDYCRKNFIAESQLKFTEDGGGRKLIRPRDPIRDNATHFHCVPPVLIPWGQKASSDKIREIAFGPVQSVASRRQCQSTIRPSSWGGEGGGEREATTNDDAAAAERSRR